MVLGEQRKCAPEIVQMVAQQRCHRFVGGENSHIVLVGVVQQRREQGPGNEQGQVGKIACRSRMGLCCIVNDEVSRRSLGFPSSVLATPAARKIVLKLEMIVSICADAIAGTAQFLCDADAVGKQEFAEPVRTVLRIECAGLRDVDVIKRAGRFLPEVQRLFQRQCPGIRFEHKIVRIASPALIYLFLTHARVTGLVVARNYPAQSNRPRRLHSSRGSPTTSLRHRVRLRGTWIDAGDACQAVFASKRTAHFESIGKTESTAGSAVHDK
ncbi:hypothetical protein SZ54_5070 [Rhizobium sp. UR51a]|nr:hypothetical protein SZ54_5070 [Rhizobium sp. UR51a]